MFVVITRDEAALKGLKRFYTGEPCKRQHNVERFVGNGGCVECVNRSTPHKRKGIVAINAAWPEHAIVFEVQPPPTVPEMQAALRYLQEQRWQDSALVALRADPSLMAQYVTPPTPAEIEAAQRLLAQAYTPDAQPKAKSSWLDDPKYAHLKK